MSETERKKANVSKTQSDLTSASENNNTNVQRRKKQTASMTEQTAAKNVAKQVKASPPISYEDPNQGNFIIAYLFIYI